MAKKIRGNDGKVYKQQKPFYQKWWFIAIIVVIVIGALGANGSNKGDTTSNKKDTKEVNKTKAKDPKKEVEAFVDNTVTSKDAIVKYTGSEKGKDYDGKPILYTFFEVTNKSEEAQNGQIIIMSHVDFTQNLGASTKNLEYGIAMDSPHQDKLDMLQQDINPGGTVEIAYTSKIEDESKPVTLSFKENMFDKPVGTLDIE